MKLSEQVKYVRQKLLLTQEALAKMCGISWLTISRWEREERNPRLTSIGKFYKFCESKGIFFNKEGKHE